MTKSFKDIKFASNNKEYILKAIREDHNEIERLYSFLLLNENDVYDHIVLNLRGYCNNIFFNERKFLICVLNMITSQINKRGIRSVYEYFKDKEGLVICGYNFEKRITGVIR